MAYDPNSNSDTTNQSRPVVHDRSTSGGMSPLLIGGIVIVVLIALAVAFNFVNFDTSGKVKAPSVSVSGGELPSVQMETADIKLGTETKTVELPTLDVQKPGDDGSAKK